jgi:hypothetical protein
VSIVSVVNVLSCWSPAGGWLAVELASLLFSNCCFFWLWYHSIYYLFSSSEHEFAEILRFIFSLLFAPLKVELGIISLWRGFGNIARMQDIFSKNKNCLEFLHLKLFWCSHKFRNVFRFCSHQLKVEFRNYFALARFWK